MNIINRQQHTILNIQMISKPYLYYDTIIEKIREIRYNILIFFRNSFCKNNPESKNDLIQLKLKLSKLKKEILSYMPFVENEAYFFKEIYEANTKDLDFHLKKINTKLSKSNNNEFLIFKINLESFNFDSKFDIDRRINECVIFVWENVLIVYIYIYKYNFNNEYNYKILDIVVTSIMDKGTNNTFSQKINNKLNVFDNGNQKYNQILKNKFENEFKELVFLPESKFFQRITSNIRKIYFKDSADFDVLILNVLDYYAKVFKNQNNEWTNCGLCKKVLIFDSINNGFLCCTQFRNGEFYHEKCLNL